jgi:hypothetical protein
MSILQLIHELMGLIVSGNGPSWAWLLRRHLAWLTARPSRENECHSGAAIVGTAVGGALAGGVRVIGLPWIVGMGLTKFTLLAVGGLMAAAAVCLRLDRQAEARRELSQATRASGERDFLRMAYPAQRS